MNNPTSSRPEPVGAATEKGMLSELPFTLILTTQHRSFSEISTTIFSSTHPLGDSP